MNKTAQDVVLVAIAAGVVYFLYKEYKAKKATATVYSQINQLVNGNSTANTDVTVSGYVSEADQILNNIFGPKVDGSN